MIKQAKVVQNKPKYDRDGNSLFNPFEVHTEGAIVAGCKDYQSCKAVADSINEKYNINPNYTVFL